MEEPFESSMHTHTQKNREQQSELIYLCFEEKASASCLNYCMLFIKKNKDIYI